MTEKILLKFWDMIKKKTYKSAKEWKKRHEKDKNATLK